jgi:hypothetical protein
MVNITTGMDYLFNDKLGTQNLAEFKTWINQKISQNSLTYSDLDSMINFTSDFLPRVNFTATVLSDNRENSGVLREFDEALARAVSVSGAGTLIKTDISLISAKGTDYINTLSAIVSACKSIMGNQSPTTADASITDATTKNNQFDAKAVILVQAITNVNNKITLGQAAVTIAEKQGLISVLNTASDSTIAAAVALPASMDAVQTASSTAETNTKTLANSTKTTYPDYSVVLDNALALIDSPKNLFVSAVSTAKQTVASTDIANL